MASNWTLLKACPDRPTGTNSDTSPKRFGSHNLRDSAGFASRMPSPFWLLETPELSHKAPLPALGSLFEAGKCLGLQDSRVRHCSAGSGPR